jgi:hypothetical protein
MRQLKFPSIEQVLVAYIPTIVGLPAGTKATSELPHNFQDPDGDTFMLPVVFVERISGAELNPRLDRPIVDVDVYAGDRAVAQDIAETIRWNFRGELPGSIVDGVVFTRTRTIIAPRRLAHANPRIFRYSANYELLLHPA